jgi:hypothetical protein
MIVLLAPEAFEREREPKDAVFNSESVSSESFIPEVIARDEDCLVDAGVEARDAVERDPVDREPVDDVAFLAI